MLLKTFSWLFLGSIANIDDDAVKCWDGSTPESQNKKVISGVVGAASSVTSIQVANLLRLFKIPQVKLNSFSTFFDTYSTKCTVMCFLNHLNSTLGYFAPNI